MRAIDTRLMNTSMWPETIAETRLARYCCPWFAPSTDARYTVRYIDRARPCLDGFARLTGRVW